MSRKLDPGARLDGSGAHTYSLAGRESKVSTAQFRAPFAPGGGFREFLDSLPGFLQAEDLRALARAIAAAHRADRVVADSIDHLIKRLEREFQVTSVVVTHDMKSVYQIASRVVELVELMREGL